MQKSKPKKRNLKAKQKNNLLLPRGYISWSALNMAETQPNQFIKKYILGQDVEFRNDFMDFGSKIAEALENNEHNDDPMLKFVFNVLPKYDIADKEFRAEMLTPYGNITLLAKPDSLNSSNFDFYEYKTGKTKWTSSKVQKHGQMAFYSLCINVKHNIRPDGALIWIETAKVGAEIRPTGVVEKFLYRASDEVLDDMRRRIIKTCLWIDKVYRQHLTETQCSTATK